MKPYYYSLNEYLQEIYGHKLYKLSLNGGMTCPNRDGQLGYSGCIFCSTGGSGEFSGSSVIQNRIFTDNHFKNSTYDINSQKFVIDNIDHQIDAAKKLVSSKYDGSNGYIAYFQSYTNTYADIEYLDELFTRVISRPDIRILSIATRPDCLGNDVLALLDRLNKVKPVWIELGLQTIHESTADFIRRGYALPVFDQAIANLNRINIKTIVHMIIGLPGETKKMILDTARYIAHCDVFGIKLQLLHVLKHTDLADYYYNNKFKTLSLDEYVSYLGEILEILPKNMVIHRLTGDGPKNLLISPIWSANKKNVINTINRYFKDNNIIQGRNYL